MIAKHLSYSSKFFELFKALPLRNLESLIVYINKTSIARDWVKWKPHAVSSRDGTV